MKNILARAAGVAGLLMAFSAGVMSAQQPGPVIRFEESAAAMGVTFRHETGAAGELVMQETMGSGLSLLDYDGDGDLDIYFMNSSPMPGWKGEGKPANVLYANNGDGSFTDVTAKAGVGDTGYGQGSTVGDYDNDGDPDLYVMNHGPNILYRNNNDGTFTDVTAEAGVGDPGWSSSGVFFDADADGDLDLFVTNYCDSSPENNKWCGRKGKEWRAYCTPQVYTMTADTFYRNGGDGRFTDATLEAGIVDRTGKGLGVVSFDYDHDGDIDLHVANDSTPNQLWRNDGTGHFREVGLLVGIAYSEDGRSEAGMGTDAGDYDGDGLQDLLVANLDYETNSVLRNMGGTFLHMGYTSGIGAMSLGRVGFGLNWLDADNDGNLDVFVANGHIIQNIKMYNDALSYAQTNQLFLNQVDLTFKEVGETSGFALPNVARGSAVGDLNGDGLLDIVVSRNGGPAGIYMNRSRGLGHWLRLRLRGTRSNRDGYGSLLALKAGGRVQTREVRVTRSYQSSSEATVHFGLGGAEKVDGLTVTWLSGLEESFEVPGVDRVLTLVEGKGRKLAEKNALRRGGAGEGQGTDRFRGLGPISGLVCSSHWEANNQLRKR
ncbi:MAG: CRTAC1 family protein [Acidobacteria bacterium]|nr:CRTAC1 family protein [Acidobacteriota bacterium]